jgi:hypothetical protein
MIKCRLLFISFLMADHSYSFSILSPNWSHVLFINSVSCLIICTLFQFCLLADHLYSLSIVSWLIMCNLYQFCLLPNHLYSLSILSPGWSFVIFINSVSWLIMCTLQTSSSFRQFWIQNVSSKFLTTRNLMLCARIICVYCYTKPLKAVLGVCVKYECDSCTLGLLLLSAALQGDKRIDSIIIIRSSECSIQPTTIGEGWTQQDTINN